MTYRRDDGDYRYPTPIPPGAVVPFGDGVAFMCPCGSRQVYVASPPHGISFDDDGRLTLHGSVGSHERLRLAAEPITDSAWRDRPANWCHFWIRDGAAVMCVDAACPGGKA